jgi:hypothetical protein
MGGRGRLCKGGVPGGELECESAAEDVRDKPAAARLRSFRDQACPAAAFAALGILIFPEGVSIQIEGF